MLDDSDDDDDVVIKTLFGNNFDDNEDVVKNVTIFTPAKCHFPVVVVVAVRRSTSVDCT